MSLTAGTEVKSRVITVTNAIWDERSLGLPCTEVAVPQGAGAEELRHVIDSLRPGYQVVKVATPGVALSHILSEMGFSFSEVSISVQHRLELPRLRGAESRLFDSTDTRVLLSEFDLERVRSNIFKGMFRTDRVSLNPHFSTQLSSERYWNWISDELRRGGRLLEVVHQEEPVGFFVILDIDGRTCRSVLSGIYADCPIPGLGSILLRHILRVAKATGCQLLRSSISTNNLAAMRTHAANRFQIVGTQNVFTRIC